MTRRRRPRASQEKKDRGGFFGISFVMDNCVLELGYEGQFIFIFAQKVTKLQIHSHVKVNIGVTSHGQ